MDVTPIKCQATDIKLEPQAVGIDSKERVRKIKNGAKNVMEE
jgi:hypothetical protein